MTVATVQNKNPAPNPAALPPNQVIHLSYMERSVLRVEKRLKEGGLVNAVACTRFDMAKLAFSSLAGLTENTVLAVLKTGPATLFADFSSVRNHVAKTFIYLAALVASVVGTAIPSFGLAGLKRLGFYRVIPQPQKAPSATWGVRIAQFVGGSFAVGISALLAKHIWKHFHPEIIKKKIVDEIKEKIQDGQKPKEDMTAPLIFGGLFLSLVTLSAFCCRNPNIQSNGSDESDDNVGGNVGDGKGANGKPPVKPATGSNNGEVNSETADKTKKDEKEKPTTEKKEELVDKGNDSTTGTDVTKVNTTGDGKPKEVVT